MINVLLKDIHWILEDPTRIAILGAFIAGFFSIIAATYIYIIIPFIKWFGSFAYKKRRQDRLVTEFEKKYLTWIVNEHRHIPRLPTTLASYSESSVLEMDKIFIPLSFADSKLKTEKIVCENAIKNFSRIIILGDPGSGKTTTLRYIALTFARANDNYIIESESDEIESEIKSKNRAKYQLKYDFKFEKPLIPIFVYLNRFSDIKNWPEEKTLLDAIKDQIRSIDMLKDIPDKFFENKIARGECIFLFDALDEIGSQEERFLVSEIIGKLSNSIIKTNKIVVSSREVGYTGQFIYYGFKHLIVQKLSIELIEILVMKWYEALNQVSLSKPLLETIKNNDKILALAENPMLLSLIVLVQFLRRLIPDKRYLLYEECIKILLERRYADPGIQKRYNDFLPEEEATIILRKIALKMQEIKIRDVPIDEFEERIIPEILAIMKSSVALFRNPKAILQHIEERSYLLIHRGYDSAYRKIYAFSHFTFQEYLAANELISLREDKGPEFVNDYLLKFFDEDPPWWEEVCLLYGAQLPKHKSFEFLNLIKSKLSSKC